MGGYPDSALLVLAGLGSVGFALLRLRTLRTTRGGRVPLGEADRRRWVSLVTRAFGGTGVSARGWSVTG